MSTDIDPAVLTARLEQTVAAGATHAFLATAWDVRRALEREPRLLDDPAFADALRAAMGEAERAAMGMTSALCEIGRTALRQHEPDPWHELSELRSEVESVLELQRLVGATTSLVEDEELAEADQFLRGAAPGSQRGEAPPGTPRTHWWWWAPPPSGP